VIFITASWLKRAQYWDPTWSIVAPVSLFAGCGSPNCRCRFGQKHGPYYYLTQCLAPGKIRKFLLKTEAALQAARRGTAAFSEFDDQLKELSQINTELLRRGEAFDSEA